MRNANPCKITHGHLEFGSQDFSPSRYIATTDSSSFYERLLDEPRIRELTPIRNSSEPVQWLSQHVHIRALDTTNYLEILAFGRSERVETGDLRKLVETATDVVRHDAMVANTSVTIVSSESSMLRRPKPNGR